MNILITGANGFIGRHAAEYLGGKHTVLKLIFGKKPETEDEIELDLTDAEQVKLVFSEFKKTNKVDLIIHLAAMMAYVNTVDDIDILYNNLKITENIITIARLLNPKKIINFSSIAVYPDQDGRYEETSQIHPSLNSDCLYGLSKFCSENMLEFLLRDEKIILSQLRVSQVYGEGMSEERVVPAMLKELREQNMITVFGNGRRVSNFIRIEKLLEIIDFFCENDVEGIYNVGEENLSYMCLAQRLIDRYSNSSSKIAKEKKGSNAKFCLDTTKVNRAMDSDKNVFLSGSFQ